MPKRDGTGPAGEGPRTGKGGGGCGPDERRQQTGGRGGSRGNGQGQGRGSDRGGRGRGNQR